MRLVSIFPNKRRYFHAIIGISFKLFYKYICNIVKRQKYLVKIFKKNDVLNSILGYKMYIIFYNLSNYRNKNYLFSHMLQSFLTQHR